MAKDYTKYNVKGVGEKLNKRQLVFEIVKNWATKKKPSLKVITNTFSDEIQAPQGFNYQATVRNSSGDLIVNTNVYFKFNVMQGSQTTVPIFTETHYVPTDAYGTSAQPLVFNNNCGIISWSGQQDLWGNIIPLEGGTNGVSVYTPL